MKALFLLAVTLASFTCFSQTDFTKWLSEETINGQTIQILRIPPDEAPAHLKMDIISMQRGLDKNRERHDAGEAIEEGTIIDNIQFIKNRDADFPVHYYEEELEAYKSYQKVFKVKQREQDNRHYKEIQDSIRIAQLTNGYRFINKESVLVKEKPDPKSRSIGKIYYGSYVKAYNIFDDTHHFIQIEMGSYSGYISEDDIAYSLNELTLTPERKSKLESGRYYDFEPTAAYQAQLDREEKEEALATRKASADPKRNYIRGPKGGCYYINKNGNKTYVDHSFCD